MREMVPVDMASTTRRRKSSTCIVPAPLVGFTKARFVDDEVMWTHVEAGSGIATVRRWLSARASTRSRGTAPAASLAPNTCHVVTKERSCTDAKGTGDCSRREDRAALRACPFPTPCQSRSGPGSAGHPLEQRRGFDASHSQQGIRVSHPACTLGPKSGVRELARPLRQPGQPFEATHGRRSSARNGCGRTR